MQDELQPNIKTYISNLKELSRVFIDTNTYVFNED